MSKFRQKVLSMVLAAGMIVGMLPMNVFAAEIDEVPAEAPALVEVQETIEPEAPPAEEPAAEEAPAEEAPAEEAPAEEAPAEEAPAAEEPEAEEPVAEAPAVSAAAPATDGADEAETDEAVAAVQVMIDALVIPDTDDYDSAESYEEALAELEAQLRAIDAAAAGLSEEQLAELDAAKAENAAQAIDGYWLCQIPMIIQWTGEGTGSEGDPYVYESSTGTISGADLYNYLHDTLKLEQGSSGIRNIGYWVAGERITSDSTANISGKQQVYKASGNLFGYSQGDSLGVWISIQEAATADMTLKEGTYTVKANLDTYANLTADKIIAAAGATSPTGKNITVSFHHYIPASLTNWTETNAWVELTSDNLDDFLKSEDQTTFRLICGNTTKEITVSFEESRSPWSVSYSGDAISYTGDDALIAAVKSGLSISGVGTAPEAVVSFDNTTLPAVGATGDVTFNVSVAQDDAKENLAYSGTVTVSVTMPAEEYDVTVTAEGEGTARVDKTKGPKGTVVTVTATPNAGSNSSKHYVKSITVDGVAIEGNSFTLGEADAAVVVTFGTRSITAEAVTIYMNSQQDKKDQYVAKLIPANLDYTLTGDGDQSTVKLQVYANWGLTQTYSDVSSLIGATHCDIPASKTIKLTWPAEGDLPEVYAEFEVTILDSYRTVTYVDGESTSTVGTELNASYTVATPEGAAKEGHSLTGWTDGTTTYQAGDAITITDNVTLTAVWAANSYAVTWDAANGTEPVTDTLVFGTAITLPAAPEKAADVQYTYTFETWADGEGNEPSTVPAQDITYTAQYTPSLRSYTLTFKNEAGETIETLTVAYGTEPGAITGIPAVPAKEATAQYTYTANDWGVQKVTGDATYTASYTATVNTYTVTWKNRDGDVLETDENVPYGTTPEYNGETPKQAAGPQYTYTFKGWSPEVKAVEGNVIYVADYDATINSYTITWNAGDGKFSDGSKTKTTTVDYGQTPVAPEEPSKAADDETKWEFGGWGDIKTVTDEATYTATYTKGDAVKYMVTWYGEDGKTVIATAEWAFGSTPNFAGETPTKDATAEYTYTFDQWIAVSGVAEDGTIEGEARYKASFAATKNKYTVTWSINGTEHKDLVEYGALPVCSYSTAKAPTAQYSYTFSGWDKDLAAVTGDVTYIAQYSETVNTYTITWKDGNGAVLKTDEVAYGETPAYSGETTPTKAPTTEQIFNFNGDWSPAIVTVTQDASYTARFDAAARPYTITWKDGDGKTLKTEPVAYGSVPAYTGETPTKTGTAEFVYTWNNGWDVTPAAVTGEASYTATFDTGLNAKNGTVYINGYLTNIGDRLTGLKAKVLDAAFGAGNYNAADYTVSMVTGTGTYNVETTNVIGQGAMALVFNVGDNQGFVIAHSSGISKEVTMSVKDSRLILEIDAKEESISFEGKTEVEGIQTAVKSLFTITSTDPVTGEELAVNVSDSYVSWSPAYAWPADAQTGTFTVTVKVNSAAYQNAPSASVTVTLTDTTILYTVTYLDGYNTENNVVASYTIAENLAMEIPENPSREYYKFAGWNVTPAEKVTDDVTYTATWTPVLDNNGNGIADEEEKYTVVYVLENGEANVTHAELAWGADTPAMANPIREGYNFKGWEPAVAATVSAPTSGNTITYTAQWTQNHAVIFMNNGKQYATAEVENLGLVTEPEAPVWDEDHDFLGWYNGEEKYDFNAEVSESLTLTAKWQEDFNRNDIDDTTEEHFTVIYDVDGEETKFENVLIDTETPAVADPVKANYKFNGWLPEVAETVTDDATYVAQWLNDNNNNGVDDSLETLTLAVTGEGNVGLSGATQQMDAEGNGTDQWLYDSTGDKAISVKAVPVTSGSVLTEIISSSYVKSIAVDGTPAEFSYGTAYDVTYVFTAEGSQTVSVEFAPAGFVFNEERFLNFYPGMEGVVLDDVYNTIVDTPDLPGEYTLQYFARPASSHTVNLGNLGLPELLMTALKTIGYDTITIDMPDLWLDVEVNDLSEEIANAVSLDQACAQYLTVEKLEGLIDVFNNGGGLLGGGLQAVKTELDLMINHVKNAAMYYGAHSFGYNATDAETVTETIKVTYKNAERNIEGETDITLKDLRAASYLVGNNVSVMYRDYTDESLAALIAPYVRNAEGAAVEGATVVCTDIVDPYSFEGKSVSDTAYELTYKFAGNETYKPSEGTFTVTVTKASAQYDAPNTIVTYGEAYEMLGASSFTLGNAYGDYTEVRDSMIQFVIGLDVAELDVDADGVTGLNGKIQIILPAELKDILDTIQSVTGGNVEEGIELSLSDLVKYLEAIPDDSLAILQQALDAIQNITEAGDITVTLGGALPSDTGAYLYGAVSTSSNYETAFDVSYIVIKPAATQVYLDWNFTDTNGVFTYELLYHWDLGASAYDDAEFATLNDEATALVNNVIFGVVPGVDAEGNVTAELITTLYAAGSDPEDIEKDLGMGAYTQLAFVAEFGNELYYAVPIVRAFVLSPNMVDVEIGDEADTNTVTFNGQAQELDVSLSYSGDAPGMIDESALSVSYTGIQTNTKTYGPAAEAPTNAGAYVVTAVYLQTDESGNVIAVGGDVEPLVILPMDSEISVTGGTYKYDGEEHGVTVAVSAGGKSINADVTIVSGYVGLRDNAEGVSLADVVGTVNVDLPKWLETYMAENHPHAYTNGLTKADFARKLNEYSAELAGYGIDEETVSSLLELLNDIPADVQILFNNTATYSEPGAYAYVGIVTDSDYMPAYDTGLLVIERKPLTLDMKDTTVTYDGEGHFVDVVCEPVTDYMTLILDRANHEANLLLEDDLMELMNLVEGSLGTEIPESITILEMKTALEEALTKLAGTELLPSDMQEALDEIVATLNSIPDTSTIYINGALPSQVGEYEFYGAAFSTEYMTQLTQGKLTIEKRAATLTMNDQSKIYGDEDPELIYEIVGLVEGDDLKVTASRTAGEDVGTYAITATVDNDNYNVTVVDGELTIEPKVITKADVALNGELTYNGVMQIQYITIDDDITYDITGNRGTDAGDYTLTVTGTGNYTGTVELAWSIAKADAEITVDTTPITVTYGETVTLPSATSNFGEVTCDKTAEDLVDAGTYTVTYTVAGTDNYNGATETVTVTINKADASLDKAPAAIEDLTYTGEAQDLVTAGLATGGTLEYSLDGETWSEEIPTATDAGEYTVYYRVKGDKNHEDLAGGSVKVSIAAKETDKMIEFPADGAVQPGSVVEIDGVNYTVDADRKIKVDPSMTENLIVTSYSINANSAAGTPDGDLYPDAHKAYPQHMYVWYVEYDAANDCYRMATEIEELRDFFTYAGTSIRYSSNLNEKHGIRIITSVNEATRASLIEGTLIENEALEGWKLVEYGTVFKNSTKAALPEGTNLIYTGQSTGNASVAYGNYNGQQLDRVFNRVGGTLQFTGMLVELEDELLDDELIMRPYMVLESPDGERITIHGGSLQRNIGYVAWQNRNFNGSSSAKAFIQNIITKVYG